MPTFIESGNCKGLRPSGIIGARHNMRPELVGRLIKDRHLARYMIAPAGYGRSSLAFEYSQLVFEFKHVFWIRCTSPCFLRDLDNGTMVNDMVSIDPDLRLVVFDDVPALDETRADAFNAVVEELLGGGAEVIAICTPSDDAISTLQAEKVLIRGSDLLLSQEEIELERLRGNLDGASGDKVSKSGSSPSQIWGPNGHKGIIMGLFGEDVSPEARSMAFAMLVLGKGSFGDLEQISSGELPLKTFRFLGSCYPIFGIDDDGDSFSAADVPIEDLKMAFEWKGSPDACCAGQSRTAMIKCLSGMLAKQGRASRAIALSSSYLSPEENGAWLSENGFSLLCSGTVFDAWKAASRCRHSLSGAPCELTLVDAWGRWMLKGPEAATGICRSWLRGTASDEPSLGLSILAWIMESEMPSASSSDCVEGIRRQLRALEAETALHDGKAEGASKPPRPNWAMVAEVICALGDDDLARAKGHVLGSWNLVQAEGAGGSSHDYGISDENGIDLHAGQVGSELMTALICTMALCGGSMTEDRLAALRGSDAVVSICGSIERTSRLTDAASLGFLHGCVASRVLAIADADGNNLPDGQREGMMAAATRFERIRDIERGRYVMYEEALQDERDRFSLTHPSSESSLTLKRSAQERVRATVPTLCISLFGGFSAKVDDERFQIKRITRAKSKKALSLLAICRGSEVSKERMGKMLWPESDRTAMTRNFYVVWANLKKCLTVNGTCPYLVKSHIGYKLDMRHVSVDLDGFDDLCRRLMFGKDDMGEWESLFELASGEYSAEILPEFPEEDAFSDTRRRCEMQLVDGLVAASARLLESGERRGAVWFAREALSHDDLREDVYKALMESYIATDQRASALDAYFQCRKRLRDELGIDPSPGVVGLYRSIIETEETI